MTAEYPDYSVRYNRSTNHIEGLHIRSTGSEFDYAQSTCGALTRGATRMAYGKRSDDLAEILKAACANGRALCKNCEKAAEAQLSAAKAQAEAQAAEEAEQETVTATETVDSSQLRTGDIVLTHGMRVRLDGEVRTSDGGHGRTVYAWTGTVLNLAEVLEAGLIPAGYLRTSRWQDGQGWVTDRNDVWVIQGNDLAHWTVERTA